MNKKDKRIKDVKRRVSVGDAMGVSCDSPAGDNLTETRALDTAEAVAAG